MHVIVLLLVSQANRKLRKAYSTVIANTSMKFGRLRHANVKARVLRRFVIKMYLRASGDNANTGKRTIMKSYTQVLVYSHFHCENTAVVIALHTSDPENAPVQCTKLSAACLTALAVNCH